jgi:hypothetical protein
MTATVIPGRTESPVGEIRRKCQALWHCAVPECAIWMIGRLCVLCLRHRFGGGHAGFSRRRDRGGHGDGPDCMGSGLSARPQRFCTENHEVPRRFNVLRSGSRWPDGIRSRDAFTSFVELRGSSGAPCKMRGSSGRWLWSWIHCDRVARREAAVVAPFSSRGDRPVWRCRRRSRPSRPGNSRRRCASGR